MTRIILEECSNAEGKYVGTIGVTMTSELYERIKKDKSDTMGYEQYKAIMKNEGYPIE